ncbi:MAG: HAMP domain-containing sensor histidine kinase [Acidobacteriaceae bacterium]|jgi:two-component system sensor histidine kinase CpxA|nr:HAMP domain-containing sensor histidine kinase [Acidobacteriaceae bacterium]
MKSISLKITIWSVAALAISLAVFFSIGDSIMAKSAVENFNQVNQVLFRQAIEAYQTGGSTKLGNYMHDLNRSPGIRFRISDASGHDLVTGEDNSDIIRRTIESGRLFFKDHNRITLGSRSENGHYFWLMTSVGPSAILFAPFYLLLLVTVVVLYWLVTMYITRPVRQLANVVDRFGVGELTARAAPKSKDEVGNLGTSFNAMAQRIQTLLMTERQLLQDVSHELRSPLARLTFEAEMVRSTTDRDAAATRLRRDVERLSELVGTLIDMARAEGEPGDVEMETLCLNDLLLITAEDSEIEAQAAGCRVVVEAPQEINLQGNAELLRRAIENILRNAIRYTPPESAVEVRLEREANCARITIRDYGPGIPEQLRERIFDPFFRADASRDERTGGLGLGLAIARRAARVHHGDITAVDASPGALLTMTLPLHPEVR